MKLSRVLKQVQLEASVSDLFPITHLNSATIFESHSGLMGGVLKLSGAPFELEEPANLNQQNQLLHQALLGLDERFMVYVNIHRRVGPNQLMGKFQSKFSDQLNKRYMERFAQQTLYVNDLYLCLVLKGDSSTKTTGLLNWAKLKVQSGREPWREEQMRLLNQTLAQLEANLSKFKPRRLGEQDSILQKSELTEYLGLMINAGTVVPFRAADYFPPIASHISETFKAETCYPNGNLGQYLSLYQLFFGEYIQFQGNSAQDTRFAAMLSLKKYPQATVSILMDLLLSLDAEFISTQSFAPIASAAALKEISLKRNKLINAEDKAGSQIHALEDLEDDIAAEEMLLGQHHHSLMLLAPNKKRLEQAIIEASKRYAQVGIAVVKESLNLEPAFWGQIPCNQHLITRASLITSKNFADLNPLHNTQTGIACSNHLKNAVSLLETPAKTPVFFNYHGQGSASNPAKGHTAVFGGNNAGKTTLVSFMDAQMGRFGGRSFFIDRDESAKIYILASGNSSYSKIGPSQNLAMNPLSMKDSKENRAFLKLWFQSLLLQDNETEVPADIAELSNECIDYAFEQLSPEYRSLSYVAQFLPVDFPRWAELRKWLKGQGNTDGEYHWLFDNPEDALNFDFDKVGFDVTYLMDQTPDRIANPVYLYLVQRMRQCLDGRLTSFVIDEAWQLFSSSFWIKCLADWLPTIRKLNGHFIFMTQSPKTVTHSAIKHVVLDNLATMLVFPNPMADRETYIDELHLTESQYAAIKENTPESRIFLYKQEQEAILCKLDLSHLADLIPVLSGNIKSVQMLDSIMKELGPNPDVWLPSFLEQSKR